MPFKKPVMLKCVHVDFFAKLLSLYDEIMMLLAGCSSYQALCPGFYRAMHVVQSAVLLS